MTSLPPAEVTARIAALTVHAQRFIAACLMAGQPHTPADRYQALELLGATSDEIQIASSLAARAALDAGLMCVAHTHGLSTAPARRNFGHQARYVRGPRYTDMGVAEYLVGGPPLLSSQAELPFA